MIKILSIIYYCNDYNRSRESLFITNCKKLQFKKSTIPNMYDSTIFMDWSEEELSDLGNLSVKYSGIASLYEHIEPTEKEKHLSLPQYSFKDDSLDEFNLASKSCSSSWATSIIKMAESAVDNKIQFSINQLLECLPKSEELNECEGIHPKQLTMYLSEVGLVSKQEFVDCNSIQSKTTYRFTPIYPESPNAGGLMNLVAEGKPVFAMVSLDLTKLVYIKDMSNIDTPYKCGSYEPSMYGIVSGYKYDEEMMEDSY